jgi:hypothetical protein
LIVTTTLRPLFGSIKRTRAPKGSVRRGCETARIVDGDEEGMDARFRGA